MTYEPGPTRDGDPPNIPVASVTASSKVMIDDEINKLTPGQILFNPAQEMKVRNAERVEVRSGNSQYPFWPATGTK